MKLVNKNVYSLVHDPNFHKPLSEINIDYSKKGQIILVTKMSKLINESNNRVI